MPRSFSLPDELQQLAAFANAAKAGAAAAPVAAAPAVATLPTGPVADEDPETAAQQQQACSAGGNPQAGPGSASTLSPGVPLPQPQELWMLKTAQHLGKGLKLVPLEAAAAEAGRPRRRYAVWVAGR